MSTRREREERNRTMSDDYFGYGYPSDDRPMQKSFLGVAVVSLAILGITTAYDKVKELVTGKKKKD